ncbi:YitT family protein [Desulforamulus ruminis]|uniref:YitT family protein n=1 Tax=Desulforamulus ruminis (strain ATCC 23193 / DSM 2154 / NCIMB 8452 / DL) TaxID=696281 RepID=F6DL40_DESRL|nr:YitT family protein [Desulforamulus ruminis]AEG58349.1 protein of unknown function DUF161 [Desulforamulus ruminis DSM 2154]
MPLKKRLSDFAERNKGLFAPEKITFILLGTAIVSFAMYNIHQQANITEGGVLGMILLLNHWFGISPSLLSPVLDAFCYALAFKYLGRNFLKASIVSTLSLAGFFKLWEQLPPILPDLSAHPLIAALAGGLLVGVGVGLVIRQGGSSGGDDALALTISKVVRCRIAHAYLATDIAVLLLSLSYIPLRCIAFSLVTVTVSSLMVDFVQNLGRKRKLEKY